MKRTIPTASAAALLVAVGLVPQLSVSATAAARPACQGVPATIVGTTGDDRLVATSGRDVIAGLSGNDRIRGLDGNDLICGGRGGDRLGGGGGADRLFGQSGGPRPPYGDTLIGGPGNDYFDGGDGDQRRDRIDYSGSDTLVAVDTAADTVQAGPAVDRIVADYRGEIIGSRFDDRMRGSAGVDWFEGGPGNDELAGGGAEDTLGGGPGADTVSAGPGGALLYGDAGRDTIHGGPGRDIVWIRYFGPDADSTIRTYAGDDFVKTGPGDVAYAGPGDDVFDELGGVSELYGEAGDDSITSWDLQGGEYFDGGPGTDSIELMDTGGFTLDLAAERVTAPVSAWAVSFEEARGASGSDTIYGSDADEAFYTDGEFDGGNDTVVARGGDDVIFTHGGDDHIDGGAGTDEADAGRGNDTCSNVEAVRNCES